jgi:glycerophosphoryl diester phosphodiesterase
MYLIKPHIIGHRGACGYAPENTEVSFRSAQELGVKWVEFDVMLGKCGEAVVIHDTTVDRTTNGKGPVIDYSLAELQQLDAGEWFDKNFRGEKIPRFIDVMKFLQQYGMHAVIEMKPYPGYEKQTAETIFKLLTNSFNLTQQIVSSFSLPSLQRARVLSSDVHLGLGVHEWNFNWEGVARDLHCQSIHINHKILTPEKILTIKSNGFEVFAYTVNDLSRAKELFSWGVDAIFSDYPDKFQNL